MTLFRKILIVIISTLVYGCGDFSNPFADDKVLATVGDESLYMTEVLSIFTPGLTPQDSVKLLDSYVDMWVKKQLKIQEAEKRFKGSVADIDRMVEDYRNSLLSYKLDQLFVDNNVDTVFTNNQIEEYYNSHKTEFILDRAIVKGYIVKVPDNYRQLVKLKELMKSSDADRQQDFKDMCEKNNFEIKEYQTWTDFSEFILHLPVSKDKENISLSKRDVQEVGDSGFKYLVMITQGRGIGDQVPFETPRIQEVIRRVLINQRKHEVIRAYEDSLYNHAVATKMIVVNVN